MHTLLTPTWLKQNSLWIKKELTNAGHRMPFDNW